MGVPITYTIRGLYVRIKKILLKNSPRAVQFTSGEDFSILDKFHIKRKLRKMKGIVFNTLQRKLGVLWFFALR